MLCLADPTLRSVRTRVRSCLREGEAWALLLEDELLYPEGGGQPDDHGEIEGMPVRALRRSPEGLLHVVDGPLEGEVEVRLDWARRFDHMQQHSGQHLLSAIAQDRFGLPTLAFHLGAQRSDIEVDGAPPALARLEDAVNAAIREARPLRVREVGLDELGGLKVRSRGLPEGHRGRVRLVEIDGIDLNTCGGTHVAHTGELQALALVGVESLKRGTRLHFCVGGRVLAGLHASLDREAALTRRLSCPPEEHLAALERAVDEARRAQKALGALYRELGTLLGTTCAIANVVRLHRPEGDPSLLSAAWEAIRAREPDARFLGSCGAREGVFLVAGPRDWVEVEGPAFAARVEGKGGGPPGRYQGKAARLDLG